MAKTSLVVGTAISSIAIVSIIFFSLNSITEISQSELIVTNGHDLETVGEITPIQKVSEFSLIEIFEKTEASVVQVNVRSTQAQNNPGGMGSGFVYSQDGYIITNNHVIDNAEKVTVTFLDGESYIAEIVGTDADLDLGVLKVEPDSTYLQPIKLGDSSKLKVGEPIAAIGNPFGLSGSMTSGIISQMGRLLPQDTGYSIPDVIQTDAAINPGNSGGPLLNMKGEVVGINTAIQSATGEFTGVGFAVPANTVKKVVPVLIENGVFHHPWMGISGSDVDPELADVRGLNSSKGFLVVSVIEGSPADEAGLQEMTITKEIDGREFAMDGDIILKIDDVVVRKISDILIHLQREKSVGDEMLMTLYRNGTTVETILVLGERPQN
jgi:S1-C subfamily serine protease|tara:strand:- start:2596 stop:3738 length:1143 start_codon:yes stop_codon:yes gene_type:complete